MLISENAPIAGKTTMRIGGTARYFAQPKTREEVEQVCAFVLEQGLPLIILGGGSNTVFEEGTIDGLVVRIKHDEVKIDNKHVMVSSVEPRHAVSPFDRAQGDTAAVTVGSGKILAMLINELAIQGLDLSSLTGIPGTIGGAIFGNAGQGLPRIGRQSPTGAGGAGLPTVAPSEAKAGGIWIGNFVESVTFYHGSSWQTWNKEECAFRYRESAFKDMTHGTGDMGNGTTGNPPIIWEVQLRVPKRPQIEIEADVQKLLQKRIETQPHLKTAGSCFKSLPDGTPAWKLIDAAGLRGKTFGGIQISEKHANFLLNVNDGKFADAVAAVEAVKKAVPQIAEVEMRFIKENGSTMF